MAMAVLSGYRDIDALYEKTAQRFREIEGIEAPPDAEEGRLIANFFLTPGLEHNGSIWAGEAGGFQDYLFGFGMRYALTSGVLAAKSICENLEYNTLYKASLGDKQKISLLNRFLYEKGGTWVPGILIEMARRSGNVREFLRKFYNPGFWPWRLLLADAVTACWDSRKIVLNPKDFDVDGNAEDR